MEGKNFETELYHLDPGECFILDNEVFMESDEQNSFGDFWCIRLRDGMARYIHTCIKVIPIKADIITVGDIVID